MADFETSRLQSVTPEQLRREVLDPDEIAVVDVREGDHYASGHISVAVELPFSEIELRAAPLLPRGSVRIVVTDDDGASLWRLPQPPGCRRLDTGPCGCWLAVFRPGRPEGTS